MPLEFISWLKNLGFAELILWLLSFAIVYGLLEQIKMPKDKITRGIISLVFATFVLFSVPAELISVLTNLSSSLLIVILGILIFMVFLGTAGVKSAKYEKHPKGGYAKIPGSEDNIFKKHWKLFAILFIFITVLIFIGAGGFNLFGIDPLNVEVNESSMIAILFFGVIIVLIGWLVANPDKEEGK